MRRLRLAGALGFALFCLASFRAPERLSADDAAAIDRVRQDVAIGPVVDRLRSEAWFGAISIDRVALIDPLAGQAYPDRTVIVRAGKIAWIGRFREAPRAPGAVHIDGRGRFLSPGLVDMHVHTTGSGQHLLRLAAGVTAVRDMDGFPWMLRLRSAIAEGRMIGATEYVAGTIIADHPLFGYAVVVRSPEEARAAVRDQAACGYSFIKVHNRLAEPLFDAVAAEARRLGLDLVGHVPHNISLRHAIGEGRLRTAEHLKGFLSDRTLLPSDEDYGPAISGSEFWITPTFYTRRDRSYGAEAQRLISDPRMRYVPRARRESWMSSLPIAGSQEAFLHDRLIATDKVVMRRLLPLRPRWLAGTDAAGYPFNIAGFALHDELVLMREAGLSNAEVVRAATSEPAAAMRAEREFGRIGPGLRADLVLLAANPLADLNAYRRPEAVIARGRLFGRAVLDRALDALAEIYDRRPAETISARAARSLVRAVAERTRRGDVLESEALLAAAAALKRAGYPGEARSLESAAQIPASGPCVAVRPS